MEIKNASIVNVSDIYAKDMADITKIINSITNKQNTLDNYNAYLASRFLMHKKRINLIKKLKDDKNLELQAFLNAYLIYADSIANGSNLEINNTLIEIKNSVNEVVEKIIGRSFSNFMELSSMLDSTILLACDIDQIFSEEAESFKTLQTNNLENDEANLLHKKCTSKKQETISLMDFELNKPNKLLTSAIGQPIDLLGKSINIIDEPTKR